MGKQRKKKFDGTERIWVSVKKLMSYNFRNE